MGSKIEIAPERDFGNPIRLMMDCHRRIERFLGQIEQVIEKAAGEPLDTGQAESLDTALRYFAAACPLHNADEEESLFPRLRAAGILDTVTGEAVGVLETDHRAGEKAHAAVDTLGRRWLAEGRLDPDDLAHLDRLVQSLKAVYQRHIAMEDRVIFALAENLPAPEVSAVGREMAIRRGLDPDDASGVSRCAARRNRQDRAVSA